MKQCWTKAGPYSWCLYEKFGHRDQVQTPTERRPREEGGGGWSYAATSQGIPEATRGWKGQGRIPDYGPWEERGPADTLILDFWTQELCEDTYLLF